MTYTLIYILPAHTLYLCIPHPPPPHIGGSLEISEIVRSSPRRVSLTPHAPYAIIGA